MYENAILSLSLSLSHIRIATSTSVRFFFSFFAVFYSNLFFLEKFICALVKNIIVPIKSEGDYKNKKVERWDYTKMYIIIYFFKKMYINK